MFVKTSFASMVLAAVAQASFHMGGCPAYTQMAEFDVSKYVGTWYEVVRDKFTTFEILSGCVNVDYGLNDDGSISVHNKGHRFFLGWNDIEGSAVQSDVGAPGSLVVDFFNTPDSSKPGNYNVISTDYDTYTVVYSCNEHFSGLFSTDVMWILAREQSLEDEALLDIIKVIDERVPGYNFFENHHMTRQNLTCPYDKMPKATQTANFTQ